MTPLKDQQNSTLNSCGSLLSPSTSDAVSISNWVESSEVAESVQEDQFVPPQSDHSSVSELEKNCFEGSLIAVARYRV